MEVQKIFFSYSRMDSPFALKLAKDLRECDANIWIDQLDIQPGSHWDAAVEKALNTSACVLVILSPFSTSSTNVMDEVALALETGKKIIPVMLEECPPPFRLRRLQRIDFTKDYQAGLTQLLQSLNLSTFPKKPKDNVPVGNDNDASQDVTDTQEDMLWDEACRQNTKESYEKYMINSVSEKFRAEAKLMIKQLELEEKEDELESLLWQKSKSENSLQLYQHYLEEYPDGDYKTLALAAISDLAKHDKLDLDGPTNLESSARQSPAPSKLLFRKRTIYIGAAVIAIGFLSMWLAGITSNKRQENKAWQNALIKKDSLSYAAYLLSFPNGRHMREAQLQLDSISIKQLATADTTNNQVNIAPILVDTMKVMPSPPIDSKKTSTSKTKTKNTTPTKSAARFTVGQRHMGGIIAYVNSTGAHGLVIAEKDFARFDWDAARKKCDGSKAGGFYDWRLPTKDELQKIYANRSKASPFAKGMYWSSTQAGNEMIWAVNLQDGSQGKFGRKMNWNVRPVRPF